MTGRIIVLSGTSSAGKSSLAKALREDMPEPLCYYATDQLTDGDFCALPLKARSTSHSQEFESFFRGFNRSIVAFAEAGNDLIVELVIETQRWADDLVAVLQAHDVFWVWVYAPKDVLLAREAARGDRPHGPALRYADTRHFCCYDLAVDTSNPMADNLVSIAALWRSRAS